MKKTILYLALSLLMVFTQTQTLLPQALMEQKLSLERSLQERTERLVEKITGTKDMVVLVNAELAYDEPAKTTQTQAYPGMTTQEEEYLPGITYSYMPNEGSASKNVIIKKITISVTVDQKVSQIVVDRIKKEVNTLLSLDNIRGDVVDVQKIAFYEKKMMWKDYLTLYSSQIYWIFTILLLALFLFGPLRHFFSTIVKAMEIRIQADTRIRGGFENTAMAGPGLPAGLPGGGSLELTLDRRRPQLDKGKGDESMKKFGFINKENFKNLIFLLKNEDPEKISIIASYLPPDFTSLIINSLAPVVQSKVALALTTPKIIDPDEVNKIEKEIKQKIDYLVGGEEYFLNLLDQVDREGQENILKSLEQTNPALAAKLKQSLFFFEDIVILDKQVMQKVIREVQKLGISLALSLKNTTEDIKQKIMDVLTEGARAMLAEQIDLLGEVSLKRVQEEQKAIANVVRELEKNGDIIIDRSKKQTILEAKIDVISAEEVPVTTEDFTS
ncbi:MAG: hypothetical protein A2252_10965 [Elusimicrobia bacterium RIFOXYA2_FULL_39_19]|nr:MAG: hypothetical protein A2252_10965 [Elusimicrobia bacterium RIFOXYA2_FULL_39_19]